MVKTGHWGSFFRAHTRQIGSPGRSQSSTLISVLVTGIQPTRVCAEKSLFSTKN